MRKSSVSPTKLTQLYRLDLWHWYSPLLQMRNGNRSKKYATITLNASRQRTYPANKCYHLWWEWTCSHRRFLLNACEIGAHFSIVCWRWRTPSICDHQSNDSKWFWPGSNRLFHPFLRCANTDNAHSLSADTFRGYVRIWRAVLSYNNLFMRRTQTQSKCSGFALYQQSTFEPVSLCVCVLSGFSVLIADASIRTDQKENKPLAFLRILFHLKNSARNNTISYIYTFI